MKNLKNVALIVVVFTIISAALISGSALAETEGKWVTGVTDLHVNGDVMFKDLDGYIYNHCSGKYVIIPVGHPSQKNILALILMAKALNNEIMCRIDRDTSIEVSHCDVFYCRID